MAPKFDNLHHEKIPPTFYPEEDQKPILGTIPTTDVQQPPVYEAERIIDERPAANNSKDFRVRWRNAQKPEDQWINEEDIQDYKMIEDFNIKKAKVKLVRNICLREKLPRTSSINNRWHFWGILMIWSAIFQIQIVFGSVPPTKIPPTSIPTTGSPVTDTTSSIPIGAVTTTRQTISKVEQTTLPTTEGV